MTYVKWTDAYREKMETLYHELSAETGLYNVGREKGECVISSRNVPNSVLKQRIKEMQEMGECADTEEAKK